MDKILVIDNDSAVQKILRRTLVSSGFQVAIAADGRTALALFNAEMPRVVILEPHIPGFAGEDFCREIRRRSLSVPILVLQRRQSRNRQSCVAGIRSGRLCYQAVHPTRAVGPSTRSGAALETGCIQQRGKPQLW